MSGLFRKRIEPDVRMSRIYFPAQMGTSTSRRGMAPLGGQAAFDGTLTGRPLRNSEAGADEGVCRPHISRLGQIRRGGPPTGLTDCYN